MNCAISLPMAAVSQMCAIVGHWTQKNLIQMYMVRHYICLLDGLVQGAMGRRAFGTVGLPAPCMCVFSVWEQFKTKAQMHPSTSRPCTSSFLASERHSDDFRTLRCWTCHSSIV